MLTLPPPEWIIRYGLLIYAINIGRVEMFNITKLLWLIGILALICISAAGCSVANRVDADTNSLSGVKPSVASNMTTLPANVSTNVQSNTTNTEVTTSVTLIPEGPPIEVAIIAPASVSANTEFIANINVSQVNNFCAYQFVIMYDPAVIAIMGVEGEAGITPGTIGSATIPVDGWRFSPLGVQGNVVILGHTVGSEGLTGSGHIIQAHFRVTGNAGTKSNITISELKLFNEEANQIMPVTIINTTIQVTSSTS